MAVNVDVVIHLAKSILSCTLLSVCSYWGSGALDSLIGVNLTVNLTMKDSKSVDGVTSAVRWASALAILSAIYYLQYQFWIKLLHHKKERRTRSQYRQTRSNVPTSTNRNSPMDDIDLDIHPVEWSEGTSVSSTVYYPELTMSSVWTYVYGWGLLLFVCLYCLAGVNVPSSCWWVIGMIALSFDEMISKEVGKWFICLMGLSLCGSVFAVWSGSMMDDEGNLIGELFQKGSLPFLDVMMGIVFPVSTPFIFFSIRSPLRLVSKDRDIHRLFEFALPFMTVLAVCCLIATSGVCDCEQCEVKIFGGRRGLDGNSSVMIETVAKFAGSYHNSLHDTDVSINTAKYALILISPLFAFWVSKVLIVSILTGHTTEFITAFLLVTSARYGMIHAVGFWPVFALSGAGSAFVLLLFNFRI